MTATAVLLTISASLLVITASCLIAALVIGSRRKP